MYTSIEKNAFNIISISCVIEWLLAHVYAMLHQYIGKYWIRLFFIETRNSEAHSVNTPVFPFELRNQEATAALALAHRWITHHNVARVSCVSWK